MVIVIGLQITRVDRLQQQELRLFLQIQDTAVSVVDEFFSHACLTNFSAHLPAASPNSIGGMKVATQA